MDIGPSETSRKEHWYERSGLLSGRNLSLRNVGVLLMDFIINYISLFSSPSSVLDTSTEILPGWVFGIVVKPPVRKPASHIGVPRFKFQLCSPILVSC